MTRTRPGRRLRASCLALAAVALGAGLGLCSPQAIETERIFLSNGIEVLLMPDPTSRVVTVISVVGAGSSYEDARRSGASHFLEHMLFNGSQRRTQKQLYDAVDAAGGFNNAFTRRTHAAYMMTMPGPELALALDLQSDMLFHSRIPATKLEKERGIILEEFSMGHDAGGAALDDILQRETFPNSSYGLPILGSEASIRSLGHDEVVEYYERHYVPENMQLVLLGGFDPETARDRLESTFGRQRPAGARPELPPAPPAITSTRLIRHSHNGSTGHLRLLFNAPPLSEPQCLALEATLSLLINGANSPFYQFLSESLPGVVLSCGGGLVGGPHFGRIQIDLTFAADADAEEVLRAAREALATLGEPDADRLANWKTQERASQIFSRQRSYMYAPLYSEEIALRGLWGLESRLERIADLSIHRVRLTADGLFAGPHWAILVSPVQPSPVQPSLASETAMGGMSAGMEGMKGVPPAMLKAMAHKESTGSAGKSDLPGDAATAAGAAGAGNDGNDGNDENAGKTRNVGDSNDAPLQVEEAVLESGARLVMLAAPADGSLSIYVLIEGRNFLEPAGQEGVTELLHQVMSAGPRGLTEAEFQDELAAIGAEMQAADRGFIPFDDYYTQRDFSFVRFQALDEYAAEAFGLLARMLHEPALDPVVVERERTRLRDRLMGEAASARTRGTAYLRELLYGEDHPLTRSPYGDPGSMADLGTDALAAYHERLIDPRRIWIGVASGHPRERLLDWAEELAPISAENGKNDPYLGMSPERFAQWETREELGRHVAERLQAAAAHPGAHGLLPYEDPAARPAGRGESGGRSAGKATSGSQRPGKATPGSQRPGKATPGSHQAGVGRPGGGRTPLVLAADLATGAESRTYVLETLLLNPPAAGPHGTADWTALNGALEVAAGVLSSRLSFHLREERGMAYGIGASLSELGDAWVYRAGAETRAENTDEMAAGLVRLRLEAPTGDAEAQNEEFARIAQKQFGRTLRRQEMRINQAMYTVWEARKGKPPLAWWTEAAALSEVSAEQVREALRMLAEAEPTILLMAR